eukprot:scaffold1766_cov401-Prasinococcus_capsulatus_cf.AAC.29
MLTPDRPFPLALLASLLDDGRPGPVMREEAQPRTRRGQAELRPKLRFGLKPLATVTSSTGCRRPACCQPRDTTPRKHQRQRACTRSRWTKLRAVPPVNGLVPVHAARLEATPHDSATRAATLFAGPLRYQSAGAGRWANCATR